MNSPNANNSLVDKFVEFLAIKHLRKTPERFALVEYAASSHGHFTFEQVLEYLESKGFHVSRGTVYNTINLLVDAHLLRRHVIEGLPTQYELASLPAHSHLVCTCCGKMKEVRDNHFVAFMNTRKYTAFNTEYFSHYVYGICSTCARKIKRNNSSKSIISNKNK